MEIKQLNDSTELLKCICTNGIKNYIVETIEYYNNVPNQSLTPEQVFLSTSLVSGYSAKS